MKNKVFVQLVDTLAMGGTERMSVNIAGVMQEEGWESHLIVSRNGGGLEAHLPQGVQVHFLNKSAFYDLGAFWRLIRLVMRLRPSILHAHSTSIYWAVLVKILVGRFLLVWHDHFGLSDQLDRYPRKEFVLLSKWIDRILVVNEKLENYWKQLFSYRTQDIQYIGNFPWLQLVKGKKADTFTFLNLANFRAQKDQLNLVKACKMLADEAGEFRVLLVGELVDSAWVDQVSQTIKDLELDTVVEIVGPSEQVSSYLSQAHVGILASESEGLPVALLEYGLAALPVITTKVGDCEKVISSPDLGWLIDAKDPSQLASAMRKAMEDYPAAEEKGTRLKRKVEQDFGKMSFLEGYWKLVRINPERQA